MHGHLQAIHLDREFLHTVALPESQRSLREQIAESLASRDLFGKLNCWLGGAPRQLQAPRVLAGDDPLLIELVSKGDG